MFLDTLIAEVNRRSPILIHTPWIGAVGNCSEEIYCGLLKARREGKRVCFLFPRDIGGPLRFARKKRNVEVQYVTSPLRIPREPNVLVAGLEWLLSVIYLFFKLISLSLTWSTKLVWRPLRLREDYLLPNFGEWGLWVPEGVNTFSRAAVQPFQWATQFATYLPVSLRAGHEQQARGLRAQMGLPPTAWFVCMHVREGGFYGDHDEAYFRNASIENYMPAMAAITERGGWVVRLGDSTMQKLPAMERVIDYAHSTAKCDLMDIYLIKECSLYIGSQSGIWDVANLFQKPLLMPNMCEWSLTYPARAGDLGILKHVWSKSRQRYLSIEELLVLSGHWQYLLVLDDDFVFHENSPSEIRSLVEEYYSRDPQGGWSPLQSAFHARRVEEAYKVLESAKIWTRATDDVYNKFRVALRLEASRGAIADSFLRANWDISSRSGAEVSEALR